ncbi:MAG: hypothetical protein HY079_13555 [Elusimicrobia bacterium]|nr:hypothetical protein [Elusimicrobiota bacterium]
MRRLILPAALALLSAACFAPLPCTQALCPGKVEGSYRVIGWNRSVDCGPDTPQVPVVSDSTVQVSGGAVQFVNRKTVLTATDGTAFRFEVSSSSARTPLVTVTAGTLTVSVSSGPAATVPAGVPYALPVRP